MTGNKCNGITRFLKEKRIFCTVLLAMIFLFTTSIAAYAEQVAAPTADPAAGTYGGTQEVALSTVTEGATIYYTTDSSEPTTGSTLYSAQIEVRSNMTIKAIAVIEGTDNSPVSTFEYELFAGGDGSVDYPYQVATAEQLNNVRYHLDQHFIQTEEINLNVAPYNEDAGWEPIGSNSSPFTGTFDGNGKTISNLTIDRSTTDYVGLFGVTGDTAKIPNVKLENIKVTGKQCTGALVGENGGTITNSYTTGAITGNDYVGGLVGSNTNGGSITNSYATAAVRGTGFYVGGLVGSNEGTITNSYATGLVTGNNLVGGLVGWNDQGSITNSYATGAVTGAQPGSGYVGGLVGSNADYSTITYSYWDINTSGRTLSQGGTGKTTADMKLKGTYTGWDFNTIWDIVGSTNDGYPFLRNNPPGTSATINPTTATFDNKAGGQEDVATDITWGSATNVIAVKKGTDTLTAGTDYTVADTTLTIKKEYLAAQAHGDVALTILFNTNVATLTIFIKTFPGGTGTEQEPYQVATAEQLNNVRYHLKNHFIQIADIDLSSYNNGSGWEPIGDFNGTFDGDGKTISNLTINRSDMDYVGLFGYANIFAEIKNVKLENTKVIGKDYTGALVGRHDGAITNCYATGVVTGNNYVGGLVGLLQAVNDYGSITNSYATCAVAGNSWVGGLAGRYYGTSGMTGHNYGTITNSYATGVVTGTTDYVAGLVGQNYQGSITTSYATGIVTGAGAVGGLVGANSEGASISDSYATGAVTGQMTTGGLVGLNTNGGSIINSYATGAVAGNKLVGGLVGYNSYGSAKYSYWDKDTSKMDSSACGTGKTTEDMKKQATFAGWDFTNIWKIEGSRNNGYPFLKNNPSDYTITLSSSGNGTVTGGGAYNRGKSITLGAEPSEGYNFAGWYKGAEKVSSLPNYTFTVSEDVTLTASFTAMPQDDLQVVTVGNGVVKLNDEPTGLTPNYVAQHTRGAGIRLTATPNSENDYFAYWQDSRSESILSANSVYEFIMGAGATLKAVFNRTPDQNTTEFTVIFKDKSGRILQSTNVDIGFPATPPSAPALVGYSFAGWDKSLDNVISDMTVNALYERLSTTYQVTVVNGTLSSGGTGGSFKYDMPVTVVANTAPPGHKFSHWTQDGMKISTGSTFKFFVPMRDTTLEAVFVPNETVIIPVPFITLSEEVQMDTANKTMLFTANRTVPAGYTLVESGVLLLQSRPVSLQWKRKILSAARLKIILPTSSISVRLTLQMGIPGMPGLICYTGMRAVILSRFTAAIP
mgnify:FL=1